MAPRFSMRARTFLSVLLSVLLLTIASCANTNVPGGTESEHAMSDANASQTEPALSADESLTPAPEDPGAVVFRMAVASDVHMSSAADTSASRLRSLFRTAYAYAESQDYKTLDAAVFVGDVTNYGNANEWNAFLDVSNGERKDETIQIAVMGNHEYYGGGKAVYNRLVSEQTNHHAVINGIHLIALSPDGDNVYSADTLAFLKSALEEAAADGPDKPVFVFQHHHLRNTVYVSAEWYANDTASLNALLKDYPQVIDFSGHSHAPVNHPDSIYQKDYTCVGTGTLAYFELLSGMTYGTIPPDASQAAQYWIVEVRENGQVTLQPYNLLSGAFFSTPGTDDGNATIRYTVLPKEGKAGFLYTAEKKKQDGDGPAFPADAALAFTDTTDRGTGLTIPQADHPAGVYAYRIVFTPEDGSSPACTFSYFSGFYLDPRPETLQWSLAGLQPSTKYDVSVYGVGFDGKEGVPLTGKVTTKEKVPTEYSTSVPVTYAGTFTDFEQLTELTKSGSSFAYGGKPDGDVFTGDWASGATGTGSEAKLSENRGYQNSKCLEVYSTVSQNQGLYLFPNGKNQFSSQFKDPEYLRVWVDFSEVDFRKANFGLVDASGCLYTTDEKDYVPDLHFWYLPDGSTDGVWQEYSHGADGCFGTEQATPVHGFKGWMAFPLSDFGYRAGTGNGSPALTDRYADSSVAGIYLFWDYDKSASASYTGKSFFLDEFHLVNDYTVFEEYGG